MKLTSSDHSRNSGVVLEDGEFKIKYAFDLSKGFSYLHSLPGWTHITFGNINLFELEPQVAVIGPRSSRGHYENPYLYIEWFLGCLGEHLSCANCPQGQYRTGVEVYKKYVTEFIMPENMLPQEMGEEETEEIEESEEEPIISEPELMDGRAIVYFSDKIDPFDKWMNYHLLNRGTVCPGVICIQRWPHTRDFVEISWDFGDLPYKNRQGVVLLHVQKYKEEVLRSSQDALGRLGGLKILKDRKKIQGLEKLLMGYRMDMYD